MASISLFGSMSAASRTRCDHDARARTPQKHVVSARLFAAGTAARRRRHADPTAQPRGRRRDTAALAGQGGAADAALPAGRWGGLAGGMPGIAPVVQASLTHRKRTQTS